MSNSKNNNSNLSHVDEQSKKFFSRGRFSWKKSEADAWNEVLSDIEVTKRSSLSLNSAIYAIAAFFLLLTGLTAFIRFYQKSITVPKGEHLTVHLPCGSEVELNADSKISYKPYWWRFDRTIDFEGEGFFDVDKGRRFSVVSSNGKTEVLGTSFNLFDRNNVYKVTCLTGRVKVTAALSNDEVFLDPMRKAVVNKKGKLEVVDIENADAIISWKNNLFLFAGTPISIVFNEIERQFGVDIVFHADSNDRYTGNFSKSNNVETVLDIVCPALGLKYDKKSRNEYYIFSDR